MSVVQNCNCPICGTMWARATSMILCPKTFEGIDKRSEVMETLKGDVRLLLNAGPNVTALLNNGSGFLHSYLWKKGICHLRLVHEKNPQDFEKELGTTIEKMLDVYIEAKKPIKVD